MKNKIAKYLEKGVEEITQDDWITYIEMLLDYNQEDSAQEAIDEYEKEFGEPY